MAALLLAGGFGLAAMMILPGPGTADRKPGAPPAAVAAARPPGPADRAVDGPVLVRYAAPQPPAASSEQLVEFCAAHVSGQRSFVLFQRGSCVIVSEPSDDPVAEAVALLEACADSDARFVPERTRDGGLIVSFKEPVFHRFSHRELGELAPWLNQVAPALMTPEESMVAGSDWEPPYQARVGLLARRRLLEDAAAPVAVRVVRAKQRETAAR